MLNICQFCKQHSLLHFLLNYYRLDGSLNRGTHYNRMPARSGGSGQFCVGKSGHSGQVMVWGAVLGDGR